MTRTTAVRRLGLAMALIASAVGTVTAAAAPRYTILDLGTLGGNRSTTGTSAALSAAGQVVGQSELGGSGPPTRAFLTPPNAAMTALNDLGTLGGRNSWAHGVNASGQVTGSSMVDASSTTRAFRTAAGAAINPATDDLGAIDGTRSIGYGINASGQVVGQTYVAAGDPTARAFRTTPTGKVTDPGAVLGTLGGRDSLASAINASGQAVGWSNRADGSIRAFRTAPNGPITPASDLGTLGGKQSAANGINDAGRVVGHSYLADDRTIHAFVTGGGGTTDGETALIDLGTLGGATSLAAAINSADQIVGWAHDGVDPRQHAFVYDGGRMWDLNHLIPAGSGWLLTGATSINDLGQISGYGWANGETRAFLLTPVANPEPGTLALIAAGVSTALLRRKRGRLDVH